MKDFGDPVRNPGHQSPGTGAKDLLGPGFAGQDLDVKQRSLDLANRTLDENKMKVEIGTLAPIDVVQTQSEVASRREQMVVSTYTVTQTEDQIKKLTSSDKDPSMFLIKLRTQESPRRPEGIQIPSLEEAVRVALEIAGDAAGDLM